MSCPCINTNNQQPAPSILIRTSSAIGGSSLSPPSSKMSAACHKDRLRVTPPRSRPCLLHHCRPRKDISFAAATCPVPRPLNATYAVHSRASSLINASHKLELQTAVDGSWSSRHYTRGGVSRPHEQRGVGAEGAKSGDRGEGEAQSSVQHSRPTSLADIPFQFRK